MGRKRWAALLWLLFLCITATPAELLADPSVKVIRKRLPLDSIRPTEIGVSNYATAVDEGSRSFMLSAYGEVLNPSVMTPERLQPATEILRQIPDLWTWVILKNKHEQPPQVTVEYRFFGSNGEPDVLTNAGNPSSTMRISAIPMLVTMSEKNNQWVLSGGIELLIDTSTATHAGRYDGEVEIRITTTPI